VTVVPVPEPAGSGLEPMADGRGARYRQGIRRPVLYASGRETR